MLDIYKNIGNSLQALESSLRISISNADNFDTPGFKYTFASFTTLYNDVESSGSETTNPIQLGASMTLGSTSTDFSQGNIGFGTGLDVAISGEGFFLVSQSAREFSAGSSQVFTRAGRFNLDFQGKYLVDSFDRKVYGFPLSEDGTVTSDIPEAIDISEHDDVGFLDGGILVNNYQARKDQIASGLGEDDLVEQIPLYRISLTSFKNKNGLVLTDGSAYKATAASGESFDAGISGEGVLGNVKSESLESSNISVAKVALDMNQLNRGFSAVQGIIDDVSKVIGQLIQKLTA